MPTNDNTGDNHTRPPKPTRRKPWEDSSGNVLPDEVLKEISKTWSPRIWEAYLETLDGAQQELLVPDFDAVLLKHDAETALRQFQIGETEDNGDSRLALSSITVRKAMYKLTHRQRTLVELVYFKDRPLAEAARHLGVSQRCAGRTLRRGLARLKENLTPALEKVIN